jgi:hypothetical protein
MLALSAGGLPTFAGFDEAIYPPPVKARRPSAASAPRQARGEHPCDACRTAFFLVDRRGHALIYFVY